MAQAATNLSRRSLISAIAAGVPASGMLPAIAGASLASSAALAAPTAATGADAELVRLAQTAIEVDRQFVEACEIEDKLRDVFYKRRPERPDELTARPADGQLRYIRFVPDACSNRKHRNGSSWCVIEIDDAEALRAARQTEWQFIGSDNDRSVPSSGDRWEKDSDGGYEPPAAQRHMWEKRASPDLQARADEILRAHERHTAEIERLKAELGMDIAEARVKELVEQFSQIGRQIENTQAVTIDGIRAKAEVIGRACWSGTIPRDNDGTDQRLLASIVADLTGLPDEQPYDPDLAADQV